MSVSTNLDQLISYQQSWIDQLTELQEDLAKYRDGTRPFSEKQISNIASAQEELSKAVRNIAAAVRSELER